MCKGIITILDIIVTKYLSSNVVFVGYIHKVEFYHNTRIKTIEFRSKKLFERFIPDIQICVNRLDWNKARNVQYIKGRVKIIRIRIDWGCNNCPIYDNFPLGWIIKFHFFWNIWIFFISPIINEAIIATEISPYWKSLIFNIIGGRSK